MEGCIDLKDLNHSVVVANGQQLNMLGQVAIIIIDFYTIWFLKKALGRNALVLTNCIKF